MRIMKCVYPVYFEKTKENFKITIPDFGLVKDTPVDTDLFYGITLARTMIKMEISDLLKKGKNIPEAESEAFGKTKKMIQTYVDILYEDENNAVNPDSLENTKMKNRWESKDNVLEFISGDSEATATLHRKKYINKIRKYASENPDEVKIIAENSDGSICAKFPVSYIRLTKPSIGRSFTEEEKEANRIRLENIRKGKNSE